ncbi:hypothetical protein [Streptomyces coffeae]|uniref:Uncharacterized protein n=1 Tax=Streptomyces coffeae TaxID=621382 RepID=A0ABS1NNS7_9ACTN|nr:hypothetical protein [Streptomyces coffeae]MBL1101742.1 hypothetical protein [Streptomyces coffeae]
MRALLTSIFPELERSFDFAHSAGPLVLLSGYQTPARPSGAWARAG